MGVIHRLLPAMDITDRDHVPHGSTIPSWTGPMAHEPAQVVFVQPRHQSRVVATDAGIIQLDALLITPSSLASSLPVAMDR